MNETYFILKRDVCTCIGLSPKGIRNYFWRGHLGGCGE